jgi:endonuclease/exonuclease/phosphatase family metal-dependent hydrolase
MRPEFREQEALLLRELIDARLSVNPQLNLVVLGDFNDVKDSRSTKMIIGRGKLALIDTRPAERNGDNQPSSTRIFHRGKSPGHIIMGRKTATVALTMS